MSLKTPAPTSGQPAQGPLPLPQQQQQQQQQQPEAKENGAISFPFDEKEGEEMKKRIVEYSPQVCRHLTLFNL